MLPSSEHTGLIAEFVDTAIVLKISNGTPAEDYVLRISPCTMVHVYNVVCNKQRFGATAEASKDHILLALEMCRISKYSKEHFITLSIPFFPILSLPAHEINTAVDLIKKALNKYF